jgi:hypothetical protein
MRAYLLPALVGAWGVLNGFAVFILWWDPQENRVSFAIGLAAAALASFVIEALRERLKPAEPDGSRRPVSAIARGARFLATLISLATFELFITAVDRAAVVFRDGDTILNLRTDVLGPALLIDVRQASYDLIALAFLWIFAGAVLAAVLTAIVGFPASKPLAVRSRDGLVYGLVAGALVAPAAVLLYILIIRVVLALALAWLHPDLWRDHVDRLLPTPLLNAHPAELPLPLELWIGATLIVGRLFTAGVAGKAATCAILAALIVLAVRFKKPWPLAVFVLVVAVTVVAPLSRDLRDLLMLPVLAGIVWIVPGAILGAVTPLLENPSGRATVWTTLAAAAGIVVGVVTVARHGSLSYIYAAVALLVAAAFLRRGDELQIAWPVLAIAVGLSISSATVVVLHVSASFHTVLENVARIDALPASLAEDPNGAIAALAYRSPALADTFRGIRERPPDERVAIVKAAQTALLDERNRRLRIKAKDETDAIGAMPAALEACRKRPSGHVQFFGPPLPNVCIGAPAAALSAVTLAPVEPELEAATDAAVAQRLAADLARLGAVPSSTHDPGFENGYSIWARVYLVELGAAADIRDLMPVDAAVAREGADAARAVALAKETGALEDTWSARGIPEALELSIAGSVAFWTTVALLAAWQTRRDVTGQPAED